MLGKKKKDEFFDETDDVLVVFDDEQKSADIERINNITEDAVQVVGKYSVPRLDCEIATGREGRIFFYRAPSQSITETQRLAQLEKNTVLKQITNYRVKEDNAGMDLSKLVMAAVTIISVLMLGISSCAGG